METQLRAHHRATRPMRDRGLLRATILTVIVPLGSGSTLLGGFAWATGNSSTGSTAPRAISSTQAQRLVITPRQPTEGDPIDFRVFLGEGWICDSTSSKCSITGSTITVDAGMHRFEGVCVLLSALHWAFGRLEQLPAGHYKLEVYRNDDKRPQDRVLWATAEFDVIAVREVVEEEPNNRPGQANVICPNVDLSGVFNHPGDVDILQFTTEPGERLTVDVEAARLSPRSSADPMITLTDQRGIQVGVSRNLGDSGDPLLDLHIELSGTYLLRFTDRRGEGGPEARYRASIRVSQGVREREPNSNFGGANSFRLAATFFGDLNRAGDVDFFSLLTGKDQMINVKVDARSLRRPSEALIIITLFDERGHVLAESKGAEDLPDPVLRLSAPTRGGYFFSLRNTMPGNSINARYDVTLRIE